MREGVVRWLLTAAARGAQPAEQTALLARGRRAELAKLLTEVGDQPITVGSGCPVAVTQIVDK
jgi:hypothetical protein